MVIPREQQGNAYGPALHLISIRAKQKEVHCRCRYDTPSISQNTDIYCFYSISTCMHTFAPWDSRYLHAYLCPEGFAFRHAFWRPPPLWESRSGSGTSLELKSRSLLLLYYEPMTVSLMNNPHDLTNYSSSNGRGRRQGKPRARDLPRFSWRAASRDLWVINTSK